MKKDRKAQIQSLGSYPLYRTNQGVLPPGEAVDEQLEGLGRSINNMN